MVELAPSRIDDQVVDPGDIVHIALEVRNLTDAPVALRSTVIPLTGSSDPRSFATPNASDGRSAQAAQWVQIPFERWPSLAPGTQLRFPVTITVPSNARPGAYALGLGVQQSIAGPSIGGVDQSDARVRVNADLVSELVLTVSGDAASNVRVSNVESPRMIWGGSSAKFQATATNDGDTMLVIDSQVQLDAFLGSAGRTLPMHGPEHGYPTLPDGVRTLQMRWSDPPLVGWFQPTLVVVGGSGSDVRVTRQLPTVYVIPPWWLLLLIAIGIWLPVRTIRHRRRRKYASGAAHARARARIEERQRKADAKARARESRRRGPPR